MLEKYDDLKEAIDRQTAILEKLLAVQQLRLSVDNQRLTIEAMKAGVTLVSLAVLDCKSNESHSAHIKKASPFILKS